MLLLLLLLERHGGVGGLRVGHVVLDNHLVIDRVVGRGLGRRRAPASPAAALWALGASWDSEFGGWVVREVVKEREE